MIPNNPLGNHKLNSLPPAKQLKSKKLEDCWGWSELYVSDPGGRFDGIWILVRVRYARCKGSVVRAFVNELKSGEGVNVWDGTRYVRKPRVASMIGYMLWKRIIKARGRRSDYHGPITRAEAVYCSYYPDCDLRDRELHHINGGRTHALWKLAIVDNWSDCVAVAGLDYKDFLLALDDRPGNLVALTLEEHYLVHAAMGTRFYGNYQFDTGESGERVAGRDAIKTARLAIKLRKLSYWLNHSNYHTSAIRQEGRSRVLITTIVGAMNWRVAVSHESMLKSTKHCYAIA